MISSKHPAFAKIATKLDRAGQELGKIDGYLDSIKDSDRPVNEWARGSALALGVHNIYNGIEDVMLNLANDIDGYVPTERVPPSLAFTRCLPLQSRASALSRLKRQASVNTATNWVRLAKSISFTILDCSYEVLLLRVMARMARSLRVTARDS